MLVAAGVADSLSQGAADLGISYLVLAFGVSMLLRVAQGSATVAMITVSQMLVPLIAQSPLPYHPVYLLIATGGGSIMAGWMNDSGFWLYKTMTGLTEMEALQSKSMSLSVMGVTAFLVAWLGTIFFPMV
jgi:H+/gluconate symporter-like permease